jgi:hypothetical protein
VFSHQQLVENTKVVSYRCAAFLHAFSNAVNTTPLLLSTSAVAAIAHMAEAYGSEVLGWGVDVALRVSHSVVSLHRSGGAPAISEESHALMLRAFELFVQVRGDPPTPGRPSVRHGRAAYAALMWQL